MLRLARNIAVLVLLATSSAAAHDKFPMAPAEYTRRVDEKLARYGERLDKKMAEAKLDATKQANARRKLAAIATELRALVKKHGADGTITEAEANEVRARGKQLRGELYKELGLHAGKGE